MGKLHFLKFGLSVVLIATLLTPCMVSAQGIIAPGVGPINRSMGSAAVAAPLDAMGALSWNPASISGIERSQISFSVEMLLANIDTSSSVGGVGAGSTASDSGAMPLPNMAWVHRAPDSPWTVGFGVMSVAGFKTNFPVDPTNPILSPQRTPGTFPLGGFGRVSSEAAFIDIVPTISYALTDQLSVGFAPVATIARLDVSPLVFAGLNDANGDTISTYPQGGASRYHGGAGANFGIYYIHDCCWRFGASLKTPRWMEDFTYYTQDELGNPTSASFAMDLPMVASLGTSYGTGERWLLAMDLRYIDYENTDGFRDSGLDANGALRGLGWKSVFAIGTGFQYRVCDTLTTRLGYVYNENPIPDSQTQYNIAAPLHYEHTLACGMSYEPTSCVALNFSYAYSLASDITGPITLPANAPTSTPAIPVPGSSVTSALTSHAVTLGVTVSY